MPGPGVELIGEEEIAEVMQVLTSRALSRYGSADDPAFGAKVRTVEQEIAASRRRPLRPRSASAVVRAACGSRCSASASALATRSSCPGSPSSPRSRRSSTPGATPVLAEVDDTFNLDPADVEARITPRTKAILAVHMLGAPSRSRRAQDIADRHGIAAHRGLRAGVRRRAIRAQARRRSAIGGVYSFNDYKTITCGDGGMLVTDDEDAVRAVLRDPRPGPRSRTAPGVEVRRASVPRSELPDDRAVGRRALVQVRKLDLIRDTCGRTRRSCKSAIADLPGSASGRSPIPTATSPRISS